LKNKLTKLKKQGDRARQLTHGTCNNIRTCINAAADSVMLYVHDFCNTIFKIKHKLYKASQPGPLPPFQGKILGAQLLAAPILYALSAFLMSGNVLCFGRQQFSLK
jgi:hypothetical protein